MLSLRGVNRIARCIYREMPVVRVRLAYAVANRIGRPGSMPFLQSLGVRSNGEAEIPHNEAAPMAIITGSQTYGSLNSLRL